MLYLGMHPNKMTAQRLDELVNAIDQLCLAHQAFRYMHTKTSKAPGLRAKLDPNERYAAPPVDLRTGTYD
jgi:hypothetical protein